ncbi:hypothetical protein A0H81_13199 [Grifola frondosa]|uniref:Uncharacterized protein n=1 Tax=Grifola frondosa TaxID=5627 RepID=A0A1C7LQ75_GRIFR|nr:hypothetical protein A0H81_13199 [Grifola frondosa]
MSTTQGITKHGLVTTSSYSVNLGLSPPRAYSPLASGSVSDSGEQSRTPSPRRTRSRGDLTVATPFSHPSALAQTLVLPGSRSVTGSRKSSGTSQDRDAVAHLDLKRLLSKPARHNTSTSSTISLDSEASRVATRQPQINKSTPAKHAFQSGYADSHSFPYGSGADQGPPTHQCTVFSRIQSGGSPVDASAPSSRSTRSTAGLTPAGAVALAYKQQEMRREELAEVSGWNDHVRRIAERTPGSGGDRRGAPVMDEEEESSGPYYTVFGSSSGRIVAVGSPGDDLWSVDPWNKTVGTDAVKVAAGSGTGSTGMRGLSRKVFRQV